MPTRRSGCRPRRSVLLTNMKLLKFTTIMNDDKRTVRLLYPQWQGGVVAHWMPDIPPEDAARGYYLGAHLLAMLAPPTTVPRRTGSAAIGRFCDRRKRRSL